MIALIGLCAVVLCAAGQLWAFVAGFSGQGPGWLRVASGALGWLLGPSVVVFLVGVGLWLAVPHVLRF